MHDGKRRTDVLGEDVLIRLWRMYIEGKTILDDDKEDWPEFISYMLW
jgi:hypothetical protein